MHCALTARKQLMGTGSKISSQLSSGSCGSDSEYARLLDTRLQELRLRYLLALAEDVCDWLNETLERNDITSNNFMDILDNGVILCQLATKISIKSRSYNHLEFDYSCWKHAQSGTFFARDNVFNFLQFCKKAGCNQCFLFETNGLVMHTQEKEVTLCLLELGRKVRMFVPPPSLIRMEAEIDGWQRLADESDSGCSDMHDLDANPMPSPTANQRFSRKGLRRVDGTSTKQFGLRFPQSFSCAFHEMTRIPTSSNLSLTPKCYKSMMNISTNFITGANEDGRISNTPSKIPRRVSQGTYIYKQTGSSINCMSSYNLMDNGARANTNSFRNGEDRQLDQLIKQIMHDTQATISVSAVEEQDTCVDVKRIAQGLYVIAGRTLFIRLLKGRHVMVRVGGGWDTLEHFLSRHSIYISQPMSAHSPNHITTQQSVKNAETMTTLK